MNESFLKSDSLTKVRAYKSANGSLKSVKLSQGISQIFEDVHTQQFAIYASLNRLKEALSVY